MNLYDMSTQTQTLYDMLETGEIDEQTFNDTLDAMGVNEKIENCCKIIKQLTADAKMFEDEEKRCKEHKRACKNGCDRLKQSLLALMQSSGKEKVKVGSFSLTTRNNASVNIVDESKLPKEFLIEQPYKVDISKIGKLLKNGETVDGAELSYTQSIMIK